MNNRQVIEGGLSFVGCIFWIVVIIVIFSGTVGLTHFFQHGLFG